MSKKTRTDKTKWYSEWIRIVVKRTVRSTYQRVLRPNIWDRNFSKHEFYWIYDNGLSIYYRQRKFANSNWMPRGSFVAFFALLYHINEYRTQIIDQIYLRCCYKCEKGRLSNSKTSLYHIWIHTVFELKIKSLFILISSKNHKCHAKRRCFLKTDKNLAEFSISAKFEQFKMPYPFFLAQCKILSFNKAQHLPLWHACVPDLWKNGKKWTFLTLN